MGGRRHQLPGVVGKHFGAGDFEATPAEFDRCDRTVDSDMAVPDPRGRRGG